MIAIRESEAAVVVEVDGEFAERNVEEFNGIISTLLDRGAVQVVLNLRRTRWTSLKALKWLVGNGQKLRQRDGDLKLTGLNPYLNNLMEITGTTSQFDVYPTVEDAVASYRPLPS